MSEAYEKLDWRVQRWVFKQGWPDLREIQQLAVDPVMAGDRDVLISASTAAGKTEAAFLPACSAIANMGEDDGIGILYISPLKALINDQYRRLEGLCEMLDMPLTAWHGDADVTAKKRLRKSPGGILQITPESLEAMLIKHSGWVKQAMGNVRYVILDEFHAFIGNERGQHLLSLLNRLEHLLGRMSRPIPRIGLSATLGDIEKVPKAMRPNGSMDCTILTSSQGGSALRMLVQGFSNPVDINPNEPEELAEEKICQELYRLCRGDSHLVFANSRTGTESIAAQLAAYCEANAVPNEFFPHHGSLSKDHRQSLEKRLQKETLPTTAVCTSTLELGIDIGKVNTVFQIGAPHSTSGLRQRMGRSGRRGGPTTLRLMVSENKLKNGSSIIDVLRLELVQSLAMMRLLVGEKWFEPPDTHQLHFSTLVHQIIATTAQWGGLRADELYRLLCVQGPFNQITIEHFKDLLKHLGANEYITQMSSGELTLGIQGERLANHYSFYAVFKTPDEYRVISGSKTIGTVPVDSMIMEGQNIVFGGRYWLVLGIDPDQQIVRVKKARGGRPPKFGGEAMGLHDVVRQEMLRILESGEHRIETDSGMVDYIDRGAKDLLSEAIENFAESGLKQNRMMSSDDKTYLFPWMGDKVTNTLMALLILKGVKATNFAGVIEVEEAYPYDVVLCLEEVLADGMPTEYMLAELIEEKHVEKFDELLPNSLLTEGYGRRVFDSEACLKWIKDHIEDLKKSAREMRPDPSVPRS